MNLSMHLFGVVFQLSYILEAVDNVECVANVTPNQDA